MIGALRGRLIDRDTAGRIIVEVGGVGYVVQAGPATAARLGDLDGEVFVWIHHHVREDLEALYGFADRAERDTFEILIETRGIGPALALAILSIHSPDRLAFVIADEDADSLCLVPGIGKKTAARLLIELRNKLEVPTGSADRADIDVPTSATGARADVREALAGLGFAPEEIASALHDLADDDVDRMLREALRRLGGTR